MSHPETRDYTAIDGVNGMPAETANKLQDFDTLVHEVLRGKSFWLRDEFTGNAIDASKWITSIAGANAVTVIDDSANGACGVASLGGNANGNVQIATRPLAIGAVDFWFHARLRVTGYSASGFQLGINSGTAGQRCYLYAANGGNWFINVGGTLTDLGVVPLTAAHQVVSLRRQAGVLKAFIAGVERHSVAFATSIAAGTLFANVDCVPTFTGINLDDVALWVNR